VTLPTLGPTLGGSRGLSVPSLSIGDVSQKSSILLVRAQISVSHIRLEDDSALCRIILAGVGIAEASP